MTTSDFNEITAAPMADVALDTPVADMPLGSRIKWNEVRENITGYIFISPALLLIFVFGIFPIGYALYMSIHQWIIRRGVFLCDTPIGRGVEEATGPIGVLRQCLRLYELNILGNWGGVFAAFIGFSTLFIVYWMWVSVFTDKRNNISGIIGRIMMALVLFTALYLAAQGGVFDAPVLAFIGGVTIIGMVWYVSARPKTVLLDIDAVATPPTPLEQTITRVFRVLIGGALVIFAGVAGIVALAGVVLLLQAFSIQAVIAAYIGLLLLFAVYLFFIQDNDRLRTSPLTLRIERILSLSLRVIGLAIVGNLTLVTGYGLYMTFFGAPPTWVGALLSALAVLVVLGLAGVPFSIYVLGDEPDALRMRGYVFPLLIVFTFLALRGLRGEAGTLYAKDFLDAGLLVVGEVLNAVQWSSLVFFYSGLLLLLIAYRMWTDAFQPDSRRMFARWAFALILLALSFAVISLGWNEMVGNLARRDRTFLRGLEITVYYAFGSIPLQLGLGLLLAYVLFQNIAGKQTFRMIFFIPYVTPAVAAAVVFQRIFTGSQTSLMNSFLASIGADTYRWVNESRPFLNVVFGTELTGFMAGPSMALVSVIILGVWTYTGYNAIIFLAGLGGIPNDLYEAAKVDGASQWHLFRYITLPLLSPITFYLSLLGFIGTFQAFNTLFVMRTPSAGGTLDTAGLVIYDTFRDQTNYGLAAAQAIVLFIVILILTQLQRNVFEKRVFYG